MMIDSGRRRRALCQPLDRHRRLHYNNTVVRRGRLDHTGPPTPPGGTRYTDASAERHKRVLSADIMIYPMMRMTVAPDKALRRVRHHRRQPRRRWPTSLKYNLVPQKKTPLKYSLWGYFFFFFIFNIKRYFSGVFARLIRLRDFREFYKNSQNNGIFSVVGCFFFFF